MTMLVRGGAVAGSALPATATTGQVLSWNGSAWVAATPSATGTTPNATTTVPGLVQLAGDLAGTATAPTVAKINGATPATVATTGAYNDLTNRPVLAPIATSGAYTDLTGRPALATVATSGAYTDLTGRPALATVASSGSYGDLTNRPLLAAVATSGSYADLTGRPGYVTKTAATSRTNTTAVTADPDLVATLQTGWYLLELLLSLDAPSTGNLVGLLTGTATWTADPVPATRVTTVTSWTPGTQSALMLANNTAAPFHARALVQVTAAGTLGLSWGPAASSATATTVRAGSTLLYTKTA